MPIMMQILKVLIVVFLQWNEFVDTEVVWKLYQKSVKIGGSLRLHCNTSTSSCTDCSEMWFKGDRLLYLHKHVSDSHKYAVEQRKDGFSLLIKNVTFEDFNDEYECSYGFQRFRKNLTLPSSFEYYTRADTVKYNHSVTHRRLLLDVDFQKVHPIPDCSIYLDGENLSSAVQLTTEKIGYLYGVKMKLNHEVRPDHCEGKLLVYCRIGTKNDTIVNQTLTFECNGAGESTELEMLVTWMTLGIILPIVFVVVIMVVMKLLKVKRRSNRMTKNEVIVRKIEGNCDTLTVKSEVIVRKIEGNCDTLTMKSAFPMIKQCDMNQRTCLIETIP